jgi:hypothetical protein
LNKFRASPKSIIPSTDGISTAKLLIKGSIITDFSFFKATCPTITPLPPNSKEIKKTGLVIKLVVNPVLSAVFISIIPIDNSVLDSTPIVIPFTL